VIKKFKKYIKNRRSVTGANKVHQLYLLEGHTHKTTSEVARQRPELDIERQGNLEKFL
jgi:hypothetical protein